jgi:hypothetical protein
LAPLIVGLVGENPSRVIKYICCACARLLAKKSTSSDGTPILIQLDFIAFSCSVNTFVFGCLEHFGEQKPVVISFKDTGLRSNPRHVLSLWRNAKNERSFPHGLSRDLSFVNRSRNRTVEAF